MSERMTTQGLVALVDHRKDQPVVMTFEGQEVTVSEAWPDVEAGVYRMTLEPHVEKAKPMTLDELAERIVSLEGDKRFAQREADEAGTAGSRSRWLRAVADIDTVISMAYDLFSRRLAAEWSSTAALWSHEQLSTEARRRFDLMYLPDQRM